jgi:hypothetical protein
VIADVPPDAMRASCIRVAEGEQDARSDVDIAGALTRHRLDTGISILLCCE